MASTGAEIIQHKIPEILTNEMGINETERELLVEACTPVIIHLGSTSTAEFYRAHSGNPVPGKVFRGPTRITRDTKESLPTLAFGNLMKGCDEDLGAYGFIIPKSKFLNEQEIEELPVWYARFMTEKGLAGSEIDTPGAGQGFLPPLTDLYAKEFKRLTDDKFWQASVTSKSMNNGGLAGRMKGRARGIFSTIDSMYTQFSEDSYYPRTASVAIEGFDILGAMTASYVSNDDKNPQAYPRRFKLTAINDLHASIRVVADPHNRGMIITESMIDEIFTEPTKAGRGVLLSLQALIERQQPDVKTEISRDPSAIYEDRHDYLVATGVSDDEYSIHSHNAKQVAESVNLAVIEGRVKTVQAEASQLFACHGIVLVPDLIASQQDMRLAGDEAHANIEAVKAACDGRSFLAPTEQETLDRVDDAQGGYMATLHHLRRELNIGHRNLSITDAATALRLSEIAVHNSIISSHQLPDPVVYALAS